MKKQLLLLLLLAFMACGSAMAQTQAFKYQAVARGANGGLLTNTSFNVRITIRTGTAGGTAEYQETQAVKTDQYGLFAIEVGSGTPTVNTFAGINWSSTVQKYRPGRF
jgi:hypothetical protein